MSEVCYDNSKCIKEEFRNYNVKGKYKQVSDEACDKFKQILELNGEITKEDLNKVYSELIEKYPYFSTMWKSLNNTDNSFYISSHLYKVNTHIRGFKAYYIDIFCIYHCTERPISVDANSLNNMFGIKPKCTCLRPTTEETIEDLKKKDKIYQHYNKQPIRGLYQIIDIEYKQNHSFNDNIKYEYYYILKCIRCGKVFSKKYDSLKSNLRRKGEYKALKVGLPCDCENLQNNTMEIVDVNVNENTSCTQNSITGVEDIKLISWDDEEYFNAHIKDNPTIFQKGKFIAVDFTDKYDELGNKCYKFRHIKFPQEFICSAQYIYDNNLTFTDIIDLISKQPA